MKFVALTLASSIPLLAQSMGLPPVPNYKTITGAERAKWFAVATVGPTSLVGAGVLSAAWGTMLNSPEEYGPGWEGFGKRYGMRLTGVSTGNAMEASLGAIWGEDPRYYPSADRRFKGRVAHILKSSFLAPNREGNWRFAYARMAGNVGNNFLSNTWRVESESSAADAGLRVVWGVLGKMGSNAFAELWPDVRRKVFKR